jgi:hypothetical protein
MTKILAINIGGTKVDYAYAEKKNITKLKR